MKTIKITIQIALTMLLLTTCGENIIGPNFPPGRRDYVWTLDTLKSPFNNFTGLWGSSSSDVWTVGGGGNDEDRLWHFDGTKWSPYTKERIICTGKTLFGFSKDNVWMGGGDGRIWHYNGSTWKENFEYKPNEGWAIITEMWGREPNDVYAIGVIFLPKNEQRGFVLHYDGHKWYEYFKASYMSQFTSILGDKKNTFITGIKIFVSDKNVMSTDSVYISKIDNKKLTKIYSPQINQSFSIALVGNELHVVIDNILYNYSDGGFKQVFKIDMPNFASCVYGRNYKDLFVKFYDGLGHYNGTDIEYLYKFNDNFSYYTGWPIDFGNAVFFSMTHKRILRGFLK